MEGRGSTAQSRSTSAGSAPSDSQSSPEVQRSLSDLSKQSSFSQVYRTGTLDLPEYDYPTPWSLEQVPQIHGADYPTPLVVKNTFIGFDPLRPASLEEFYEERKIKSCPASGIGLPPGLEDLVGPDDVGKLAEAEHLIPAGLLDTELDTQQFLPLPPQRPSSLSPYWPNGEQLLDDSTKWSTPGLLPHQPIVLDLQRALGASFEVAQQVPPEPELGSAERPTLGSRGHWFGECKPCAFLYTKGCGNGIMCQFCHLCDAGEKKRRAKDKRAAFRGARLSGC